MKHLKSHHAAVFKKVKAELEKKNATPTSKELKPKRPCLNGVQMSGTALQLHCVRLVSESGMSFRMLEYPAFQDIINPMINALPVGERFTVSARNISEKVGEFADKIREKIIKEVEGKMISLKVDGASRNHRHFVGITIQYSLDDKLTVRTLAVEELLVAASAANLKNIITHVLHKFKIEVRQIVSFTSDSGANYNSAGRMLSDPNFVDSDDETENEDDLLPGADANWSDADIELLQDDFHLQSIRCAAHTLQLAIDNSIKASDVTKQVIKKVKDLAKYLLQDTKVRQLNKANLPLPKLDVCTRWGSTYDLLTSVLFLRNFVQITLEWTKSTDKALLNLTAEEWQQVDVLIKVLRPLRKATSLLQTEDLTLGDFFAIWSGVSQKLESKKDSSPLAAAILKAMQQRSKKVDYRDKRRGERYSPLFNYPAFNAAVFMDPRYLSLLSPDQKTDAKRYLVELYGRLQALAGPSVAEGEDSDAESEAEAAEAAEDSDSDDPTSLFRTVLRSKNKERERLVQSTCGTEQPARPGSAERSTKRAALSAMLDEYDRTTTSLPPSTTVSEVFKYWANRKLISTELYELAMIVLSIPATQVSVERVFSALKFILRPQRFGLSAEHIDNATFLHTNKVLAQSVANDLLVRLAVPESESSEVADDPSATS